MAKPDTGPHVQLAAICEKVLEDKDNVLSLIRVVDQVTQPAMGDEVPEAMPPFWFVKALFIRIGTLFGYTWTGNTFTNDQFEKLLVIHNIIDIAKGKFSGNPHTQYAVIDTKGLRNINAKFDPAKLHLRHSHAGLMGGGLFGYGARKLDQNLKMKNEFQFGTYNPSTGESHDGYFDKSGKMKYNRIRILVGDTVEIELDAYGGKPKLVRRR